MFAVCVLESLGLKVEGLCSGLRVEGLVFSVEGLGIWVDDALLCVILPVGPTGPPGPCGPSLPVSPRSPFSPRTPWAPAAQGQVDKKREGFRVQGWAFRVEGLEVLCLRYWNGLGGMGK